MTALQLLNKLKINPKNPRTISGDDFDRLKNKLQEFPDMLEKRPIVYGNEFMVIGGSQRTRALRQLVREKKIEVKDSYFVDASNWTEEQRKMFIINDNITEGQWDFDILANEWDEETLQDWGILIGDWDSPEKKLDKDYSQKLGEIIYEPKETNHRVKDLFKIETKFDEDISKINNEELRELFKARAYNFALFDFEKIADYYAYQATPEEQRVFERLALVLLDKDKLIENGFSKLINDIDDSEDEYELE